MRVLYCNHNADVSGAEISLMTLLDGLRPAGVRPLLACPDGPVGRLAAAHAIPVAVLPEFRAGYRTQAARAAGSALQSQVRFARIFRAFEPDLVHANSIRAAAIAAPVARLARTPMVVHVRDALAGRRTDLVVRLLLTLFASRIIAISYYVGRALGSALLDVRTTVIHNAVDVAAFANADPTAARAELGLEGRYPVIGVFGQLTPWKDQLSAIRAMRSVAAALPGARLLIVGSAKFLTKTARYDNAAYERALGAAGASLGDALEFMGERSDVPQLMAACDVVVVPSWAEPFGRVSIEAMASGKPVIATRTGGSPEVVVDGETGLLIPPRDPDALVASILRLAHNPELAQGMGRRGRDRVYALFTPERHAAAVLSVYRELVA